MLCSAGRHSIDDQSELTDPRIVGITYIMADNVTSENGKGQIVFIKELAH